MEFGLLILLMFVMALIPALLVMGRDLADHDCSKAINDAVLFERTI